MPDEQTNTNTSTPAPEAKADAPTTPSPDAPLMGSGKSPEAGKEAPKPDESKPTEEVKYEFKDVPEGYDVAGLEKFARDNKIPPEIAQKFVEREKAAAAATSSKMADTFKELATKGWVDQLKADKEVGGKNWDASIATVKRANDTLPDSIKKEIDENGLGNNPILFKVLRHFGAGLKEDSFVRGQQATGERTLAERLYGNK